MRIVISSGHGKYIRGAAGSPVPPQLDEVDEARKVVEQVAKVLRSMGVETKTFHDDTSHDQGTNLNTIVNFHNKQTRDYDISVHFNAFDHSAHGCEVLYKTQDKLAKKVVDKICAASGFTNRGPKYRSDLKFLNSTNEPAILIETCFCDNTNDSNIYKAKFNAICTAIAEGISGQSAGAQPPPVEPSVRPPVEPPAEVLPPAAGSVSHKEIEKGDTGPDVVDLQKKLGVLKADGDFGSITDTWVRAFQAACGLNVDGIVGKATWGEADDLDARVKAGAPPLPKELVDQIWTMAQTSEIADFAWPSRGVPPPGYIAGMALCFAYAMNDVKTFDHTTGPLGSSSKDALAWYQNELTSKGCLIGTPYDRLRSLFVLMMGLGPRESSGKYCEGRDMSASNVQSDTCEAGLFQTSWNIRSFSTAISPLLPAFWKNPNGFLHEFKEGISPTANNLNSYGSGDGVCYQFLSRFAPLFHVMVTAVGLRVAKSHWGPVERREVTIKKEADDLLKQVQELIEDVA